MSLKFNEKKAIQVAALLLKKRGGQMDLLDLMKVIYLADRASLLRWRWSLTGDRYAAMKRGMILSATYDLARHKFVQPTLWERFISAPDKQYNLSLLDDPGVDELSEDELELVDAIFEKYGKMGKDGLINKIHHNLPEWRNPGDSSFSVSHQAIFEFEGVSESDLERILEEWEAASQFEQYCVR